MALRKSFAKRASMKPKNIELDVVTNYNGSGTRSDKITVREVEYGGKTYIVPVDKRGFVPREAIYAHFLDYTNWTRGAKERNVTADFRTKSNKVHKPADRRGFTPEEIVQCGWWPYVNESDVEGVDDGESDYVDSEHNWEDLRPGAKVPFAKIALIMPSWQRDRAIRVIQDNFTNAELKRMTNQSGLVITDYRFEEGIGGYYRGRQAGQECPIIVLKKGWYEDTLTHEMVHCARQFDEDRTGMAMFAYPMDEDRIKLPVDEAERRNMSNLEEACTVAETLTRTREPAEVIAGYYQYTDAYRGGKSVESQYEHDRELMVPGKPYRGKRAVDRTYSLIDDTDIVTLKRDGGMKASDMIAAKRADGDFPPKGERPKTAPKKKAKKPKNGGE